MSEDKINQQKTQNFGRTTGLFMGMLALMIALGYSLFGTTGLIWAGVLGLITMIGSTQVSTQLVMRMQGARPLSFNEAPNYMEGDETVGRKSRPAENAAVVLHSQ